MIRPFSEGVLDETLFVPRAIIAAPIGWFARKLKIPLLEGEDDLDRFEGLVLSLNDEVPFTLIHHRGSEPNRTTVSLPVEIGAVKGFSAILDRITEELGVDQALIVWKQDHDDPPRIYA